MRVVRLLAVGGALALSASALVACASTSTAFPSPIGDPNTIVAHAKTMIDDASAAGADTLAHDAMLAARQHFADAQIELRDKHTGRAMMRAREAVADATYAKASADRIMAERSRNAEEALLQQLQVTPPPKGAGPSGQQQ
jgi:Spy/CpxP family protein refolding chaperone